MVNNIFLTGNIQVGKSTIINHIAKKLPINIGGFETLPWYEQNQLSSFYMEDINGQPQVGKPSLIAYCRGKKWVAVPDTFNDFGVAILQRCLDKKPDLIVMDELGFFESEAYRFQELVQDCLDSEVPVLGVLKKADIAFLNLIKKRRDIILLTVTPGNRDIISSMVYMLLQQILHEGYQVCPHRDR
ncbi:MAG: nucleoside-triphosphatase [Dehalobacterium sp.]